MPVSLCPCKEERCHRPGEAPRCDGRLAQLGERCLRKAEVESSNLLPSIAPVAVKRAISSAGRALSSHGRSHRFKSCIAHSESQRDRSTLTELNENYFSL